MSDEVLRRRLKRLADADHDVLKAFYEWEKTRQSNDEIEILRWCADYRRVELAQKGAAWA